MESYTIAIATAFLFFTAKTLIDLYALISMLKKDKEMLLKENELETEYEFIKGLH